LIGGRIILALDALVFGLFGALYWVIPEQMAAKVGVTMTVPAGVVDVQGLYGGLEVGVALFLAWCALKPAPGPRPQGAARPQDAGAAAIDPASARIRMGLVAGACALGGIAISRFVAIAHFGMPDAAVTALVGLDLLGAVLNLFFVMRYRD
jgi:hypothetical protein